MTMILDRYVGGPGTDQSLKSNVLLKENKGFEITAESAPVLFLASFGSNFGANLVSFSSYFFELFPGAIFIHFGLLFAAILGSFLVGFWVCFLSVFWNAFLEAKRPGSNPGGMILGPPGRGRGGVNHLPWAKKLRKNPPALGRAFRTGGLRNWPLTKID